EGREAAEGPLLLFLFFRELFGCTENFIMATLLQDVRYALRSLAKNPGFAAVAILTLALGIGANTAIFSVIDADLLRPLPFPDSARLVQMQTSFPDGANGVTSIPKFMAWGELSGVFQDPSLFDIGVGRMNMTGSDRPEQISGLHVSASYF